jgi:hypothetical protein
MVLDHNLTQRLSGEGLKSSLLDHLISPFSETKVLRASKDVLKFKTTITMNPHNRYYSPNQADEATAASLIHEATAEEHTIDVPQGTAAMSDNDNKVAAENVMSTEDGEERLSDCDSTILGAGGLAGGLSGDGERTDEYDAAVNGIGD